MPTPWRWWFADTVNADEWHGPFDTREAAVAAGCAMYSGIFAVQEASQHTLDDLNISAARFLDMLEDNNDEFVGPDGDLIAEVSAEAQGDLERRLKACLMEWAAANSISQALWQFAETRNTETVDGTKE